MVGDIKDRRGWLDARKLRDITPGTPVKKQVGRKGDVYLPRHTLEFRSRMSPKKEGCGVCRHPS